jgi:parallel beta-helix repeat protein
VPVINGENIYTVTAISDTIESPQSQDLSIIGNYTHPPPDPTYQIVINGTDTENDWDDCEVLDGNGTLETPYLIDNLRYNIDRIILTNINEYFIIKNCIFQLNKDISSVRLENCSNVVISGNIINESTQDSLFTLENCSNVVITGNIIYDISIWVNCSSYVNIIGNTILNQSTFGIRFCRSYDNNVSHNHISQRYYGIWLLYSYNNSIISNYCDSGNSGISLTESFQNNISMNDISNNDGWGIVLEEGSNNNTAIKNNISLNTWDGIHVQNSNGNILSDNNVSFNGLGINFRNSNNNICINNTVYSNEGFGIVLGNSDKNILYGNKITFNGDDGLYIDHLSQENDVHDNDIYSNNRNIVIEGKDQIPTISGFLLVGIMSILSSIYLVGKKKNEKSIT